VGTNEENRNAVTFLDLFGPTSPQANGYQYTFNGNTVMCPLNPMPFIWGINVSNSYYGLIQNNDLVNWNSAGIFVDNLSSYNNITGNFVMRITGTADRYTSVLEGVGYWFGNPNNYVTNNIATDINSTAADIYSYGYDFDMTGGIYSPGGGIGTVAIAAYQGADPSVAGQSAQINMNDTPLLNFSNNTVYGATPSGLTMWWLGTQSDQFFTDAKPSVVKNFTAWHYAANGIFGYATNNVTIDGLQIRGDINDLNSGTQSLGVVGVVFNDYLERSLTIQNANIQDVQNGIMLPFYVGQSALNPGVGMDTTTVQNCYLDNIFNIALSPPRTVNGATGLLPQTVNINNVQFASPSSNAFGYTNENIIMDYITQDDLGTAQMNDPQYVYVNNYNDVLGDNFQLYYSQTPSPTGTIPANATTRAEIVGSVVSR
jgi:hypothetical protein